MLALLTVEEVGDHLGAGLNPVQAILLARRSRLRPGVQLAPPWPRLAATVLRGGVVLFAAAVEIDGIDSAWGDLVAAAFSVRKLVMARAATSVEGITIDSRRLRKPSCPSSLPLLAMNLQISAATASGASASSSSSSPSLTAAASGVTFAAFLAPGFLPGLADDLELSPASVLLLAVLPFVEALVRPACFSPVDLDLDCLALLGRGASESLLDTTSVDFALALALARRGTAEVLDGDFLVG